MSKTFKYKKLSTPGIWKNIKSGKYLARKSVAGKEFKKTFSSLKEAKSWRVCNRTEDVSIRSKTSTLKKVWQTMQEKHFPLLRPSTRDIWIRRYELLKSIEHKPMHLITPKVVSNWIEKQVTYFKSPEYEQNCRGKAKRCNLDNELNLFTTIFNWYRSSLHFDSESLNLQNPIRTVHKKMGFIRAKPVRNMTISLDDALKFFSYLKPLYRDLALFQYYTASRIGEVAGLQWNRIDFDNNKVVIMETSQWDMTNKTFISLNPFPKNREARSLYMTKELREILLRRHEHRIEGNGFVFHVEGNPLNYGTIQLNYRNAQRKAKLPYGGSTHILRHGFAQLTRKVGGSLDAVIAMTGHKDFKLADHYSRLDADFQKEVSLKIMDYIREKKSAYTPCEEVQDDLSNVLQFARNSGQ